MSTLERIQNLPQKQREQILWAVVATAFAALLLIWLATSQIPQEPRTPQQFIAGIKDRVMKASADFPK